MDAALAIGASQNTQIWIAAANATGACAGKLIAPQSIAIGVAAIGVAGRWLWESRSTCHLSYCWDAWFILDEYGCKEKMLYLVRDRAFFIDL